MNSVRFRLAGATRLNAWYVASSSWTRIEAIFVEMSIEQALNKPVGPPLYRCRIGLRVSCRAITNP